MAIGTLVDVIAVELHAHRRADDVFVREAPDAQPLRRDLDQIAFAHLRQRPAGERIGNNALHAQLVGELPHGGPVPVVQDPGAVRVADPDRGLGGAAHEVEAAYRQAVARFDTVLTELVAELPALRQPSLPARRRRFEGSTARRMEAAVSPLAFDFLTPMAAVAGAVAEEILYAMVLATPVERGMVNNGGDIAIYLAHGERVTVGVVERKKLAELTKDVPRPIPQSKLRELIAEMKTRKGVHGAFAGGGRQDRRRPLRAVQPRRRGAER